MEAKPKPIRVTDIWLTDVYLRRRQRAWLIAEVACAVLPPLLFAVIASRTGGWGLFERSGSITTTVGLILAARRYIRLGVFELTAVDGVQKSEAGLADLRFDIIAAKAGFVLSALGTVIWGWGRYLQWWTFALVVLWVALIIYSVHRDVVMLRAAGASDGA